MQTTFDEAADLGELILIRDAWCERHGRVRPEGLAFPFTITAACLRAMPPRCGGPACESDVLLDAAPAETRLHQTVELVEDEQGCRPAIALLPVAPGLFALGVLPDDCEPQDGRARAHMIDKPSGMADG